MAMVDLVIQRNPISQCFSSKLATTFPKPTRIGIRWLRGLKLNLVNLSQR